MSGVSEFRLDGGQIQAMMRGSNGPAWQAVNRLGNQVRDLARQNDRGYVPVRKGNLKLSISLEIRNENGPVAYVGSNLNYAVYVHEGYRHRGGKNIPANKFLLRALNDVMARQRGK